MGFTLLIKINGDIDAQYISFQQCCFCARIIMSQRSHGFLGRLPKVDLIILEGEKCPSVRPFVRPSVHPQKVSSI